MNTSTPDFVTVDMRGLKVALVARERARASRVSVSALVRSAVARDLGVSEAAGPGHVVSGAEQATIKLSIRLTAVEAARWSR